MVVVLLLSAALMLLTDTISAFYVVEATKPSLDDAVKTRLHDLRKRKQEFIRSKTTSETSTKLDLEDAFIVALNNVHKLSLIHI